MTTQRGFTLIELAIVLVIITILIGGLAVPLSAQIQARRVAETQRTLEEVREAIFGYALSQSIPVDHDNDPGTPDRNHTYLPCPDIDQDGLENREPGGECSANAGNVPWATLGTGAQDAWGNRLHYRLTSGAPNDYGNSETNSFSSSSSGDNQICATSSGGCAIGNMASDVPVVLISYGPNSRGARNVNIEPSAPTPAAPSGTGAGELENLDGDTAYVSRPASDASHSDGEFDDLVVWIPHGLIISRVCGSIGCTETPPPSP
jgi:prepilin-type N-terminal cleavage/methylation domain-containing protein